MDRMTRKTLTMYEALHPKSDIDLYLKQKHGGRGLFSIEMCVRLKENSLGLYVRGSNEMLLKVVKKESVLSKLKILWKKKTSRKTSKMGLKINCMKRECMDSLFVNCLKK